MSPRMSPDARREQILEAVLPVVLERGMSVTSRQLAEAAGVAEGTLFRSFGDKETLLRAVLEREIEAGLSTEGLEEAEGEGPEAFLAATLPVLIGRFTRLYGASMALAPLHRHDDEHTAQSFDRLHARLAEGFGRFRERMRIGQDAAAEILLSLCISAASPWGRPGGRATARELRSVLLGGVFQADRARAGEIPAGGTGAGEADP